MYNEKFVSAVICAAGASTRMGTGTSKQLLRFGGMTVIERTVLAFDSDNVTDEIIVVCPENLREQFEALFERADLKKPLKFANGGAERQISVRNGAAACNDRAEIIAVHDGARPFVPPGLISATVADGCKYGCAAAAVPVKDTIKQAENGVVVNTPQRSTLYAVQTPQVFLKELYLRAYENARERGIICTDDCALIELYGGEVHITPGDYANIKITTPEDAAAAHALYHDDGGAQERKDNMFRIGHGYDVHKLTEGRKLIIGGVEIPYERGLLGHSDADVLTHAVMDALLGAAALGDIGGMFPDTDPKYEGADSMVLLKYVCEAIGKKGYKISNIDATVIAQKPKLKPYISQMNERFSAVCGIAPDCVNIKATTEEKLGFTGREEGISAHAVCMLCKK